MSQVKITSLMTEDELFALANATPAGDVRDTFTLRGNEFPYTGLNCRTFFHEIAARYQSWRSGFFGFQGNLGHIQAQVQEAESKGQEPDPALLELLATAQDANVNAQADDGVEADVAFIAACAGYPRSKGMFALIRESSDEEYLDALRKSQAATFKASPGPFLVEVAEMMGGRGLALLMRQKLAKEGTPTPTGTRRARRAAASSKRT